MTGEMWSPTSVGKEKIQSITIAGETFVRPDWDAYEQGVKDATDRLWRHLTTTYAPISGKGMTNGPVCVDEVVAITGGEVL